jgi:hypothetical protein
MYVGPWKLIRVAGGAISMLYNTVDDPLEQVNVLDQHPEVASSLMALLERQMANNARLSAGKEVDAVPLSAEQRARLKSLGYVQ